MRPQNRVFRLFGVVMVTLCPAGSTQPVAASGVAGLGAAATQMVCDILLTNVTRRREPAAPEGGGSEAAGAEEAEDAGVAEGIRASVGATERALGDGVRAAVFAAFAAFAAVAPPATDAAAADDGRCPPAAAAVPAPFAPRAAQPAVSMMALSSAAAVVGAPDQRALRRSTVPAEHHQRPPCVHWLRTGDARRGRPITHFVFRIFRYPLAWVVSPRL